MVVVGPPCRHHHRQNQKQKTHTRKNWGPQNAGTPAELPPVCVVWCVVNVVWCVVDVSSSPPRRMFAPLFQLSKALWLKRQRFGDVLSLLLLLWLQLTYCCVPVVLAPAFSLAYLLLLAHCCPSCPSRLTTCRRQTATQTARRRRRGPCRSCPQPTHRGRAGRRRPRRRCPMCSA